MKRHKLTVLQYYGRAINGTTLLDCRSATPVEFEYGYGYLDLVVLYDMGHTYSTTYKAYTV